MKFAASVVSSILATAVTARPRAGVTGEPLEEKSRVTAFVVNEKGEPSVECWEINSVVDSMQMQRKDGSMGTSRAWSFASGRELEGVDILTWPSITNVWPPAHDSIHSSRFTMTNSFSLFNIQGGLINFNFYAARFGMASDDKEVETHIFSLENGDDWFYFEDSSESSAATTGPYPFHISTVSATETELMRLRYSSQPRHTVIHKGACSFTGISTSSDSSQKSSRAHSPLTVQVNIEDL